MKQKIWITLAAYLAYCIDKELYHAIDYLREQVRVLVEHQEKQDKRILLTDRRGTGRNGRNILDLCERELVTLGGGWAIMDECSCSRQRRMGPP